MDTKIIELRMSVRSLPTDNRQVQLAVKAEVLRLAELLDKQLSQLTLTALSGREVVAFLVGLIVGLLVARFGGR